MEHHRDTDFQKDDSFSGYMSDASEPLHRGFTEVSLLQQTAMHQLYRAKRFGRWYMLKALLPDLRDSTTHRQMLLKEMEVLMQLNHPNIVDCLGLEHLDDYVDSEGRRISVGECIVLEYVDGETLNQALEQGVMDDASSCQHIIDELLEALAYMHASSVTHRDLKPSNIMLTRNGQHVKIIDFSLADTDSHAYLKQPSGTRQYMAPEQATGSVPDVRNDIYSLGVIMRQLPLEGFWTDVARRCLLPIDQRYPNITSLQEDIAARRQQTIRRRQFALMALPLLLLTLFGVFLWHQFSSRQDTIYNELNRVPTITAQALSALDKQIAATDLNRQMDTISHWRYLDPRINEKILSVNAFAYDYALDSLSDLTDEQRLKVLQAMLDHWQRWHDNIVHHAKYLMRSQEAVITHYAEQSVTPSASSASR